MSSGDRTFKNSAVTLAALNRFTLKTPVEIWNLKMVAHKKFDHVHMVVSKNRGTPKWIVYNGKPY